MQARIDFENHVLMELVNSTVADVAENNNPTIINIQIISGNPIVVDYLSCLLPPKLEFKTYTMN